MTDPAQQRFFMTFAVVGAGPTGVELAGQIRELAQRSLKKDFRNIDPSAVRVILIDGGKEPLANFGDRLSERASTELEKMGVELRMGRRVVGVDPLGVDTETAAGRRGASSAAPPSGPPASRRPRWPACSPRPPGPPPIAPGG